MGIVRFCFKPKCQYGAGEPPPAWFFDLFAEQHPELYCPKCGLPIWLATNEELWNGLFVNISPSGVYCEPIKETFGMLRSVASEVSIEVFESSKDIVPIAILGDMKYEDEQTIRQHYRASPISTCRCIYERGNSGRISPPGWSEEYTNCEDQ